MGITEKDKKYIAGTYSRYPVEIASGRGSVVTDTAGKEYIDMGSGIGVTAFGIADPVWTEAVTRQIGRVQHMSNLYYTEPCADLAEMLCVRTGMKKVFFSNSGAEANECAVKAARKYASDRYGAKRHVIVTLNNSFHGRTLTTLAATGQDHYHELYTPLTPGFRSIDAGDMDALKKIADDGSVAGVLIECVQGEGGVVPVSGDFIRGLRKWCTENDVVMMVDEVQTGNGRTGALYSYMNHGIEPDVVSTAKGLAGGLPLGATMLGPKLENVFGFGDHGSTFGGNPVCCAAALSVLSRIDEEILAGVRRKSRFVFSFFEGADGIESVRGQGLLIGIKPVRPAPEIVSDVIRKGVLCLTAKDRIRLMPALNIPDDLLERACRIIKDACAGG